MKYFESLLFALISISLHEAAHIITAVILGIKVNGIRVLPVGLNAIIEEDFSPLWKKVLVYLSGPAANGILYVAGILALKYMYAANIYGCKYITVMSAYKINIMNFINVNLYLTIFNILPVVPLDGSRILINILISGKGIYVAHKYIKKLSAVFAIVFIFIGFIQLFYSSFFNYSLITIGIYIIIQIISKGAEAAFMNMKQIIFRRSRLLKKGIYPVRDLVAVKTMPLGDVLKNMDFDRFHIIYVLDENFRILKMYTEQEIVDAVINYNSEITFEEFIRKVQ
ncbi:MAG: peptidase M50 [Firmicutes bacterium]|nr:peptidase M50 [Bacillota bacterium]